MDIMQQFITAFLGSLGFSMLYNVKGRKLLFAAFGGMLGWVIFLSFSGIIINEFTRYFLAALIVTSYAEVLARIEKTPSTTFLIAGIIPLVPGKDLYYTMLQAISGTFTDFSRSALFTLAIALSIAAGIMAASSISRLLFGITMRFKKNI